MSVLCVYLSLEFLSDFIAVYIYLCLYTVMHCIYCKLCIALVVSRKRQCYCACDHLKHVSSIVCLSLANLFSNIKEINKFGRAKYCAVDALHGRRLRLHCSSDVVYRHFVVDAIGSFVCYAVGLSSLSLDMISLVNFSAISLSLLLVCTAPSSNRPKDGIP